MLGTYRNFFLYLNENRAQPACMKAIDLDLSVCQQLSAFRSLNVTDRPFKTTVKRRSQLLNDRTPEYNKLFNVTNGPGTLGSLWTDIKNDTRLPELCGKIDVVEMLPPKAIISPAVVEGSNNSSKFQKFLRKNTDSHKNV